MELAHRIITTTQKQELSDSRNLKFMYSDLKVVVADEVPLIMDEYLRSHSSLKSLQVSMVGCNKLAKMSYQLQSFADGPDKKSFMGGKAFIG